MTGIHHLSNSALLIFCQKLLLCCCATVQSLSTKTLPGKYFKYICHTGLLIRYTGACSLANQTVHSSGVDSSSMNNTVDVNMLMDVQLLYAVYRQRHQVQITAQSRVVLNSHTFSSENKTLHLNFKTCCILI